MTTEIAVINKIGAALAADSAVTISGNGSQKIFNSADKLFQLNENLPIAIMINDNMNLFDVPWEILIKDFRKQTKNTLFNTIKDCYNDFIIFLEKRSDVVNEKNANSYLESVSYKITSSFNKIFRDKFSVEAMKKNIKYTEFIDSCLKELKNKFSYEEKQFLIIKEKLGEEKYSIIKKSAEVNLIISKDNESLIIDLIKIIFVCASNSEEARYSTGLIIAGYGEEENYPALIQFNIVGVFNNKILLKEENTFDVLQKTAHGHIVAFAQTDVIDRLLKGVDPKFVDYTLKYLDIISEQMPDVILKEIFPDKPIVQKRYYNQVSKALRDIGLGYKFDTVDKFCLNFINDFDVMISVMPKMELIELAEALINITAIERKASSDQGTVGGPVDVAFLSKHDGFVWIKRKHYFPAHLNPRYFQRKYHLESGRDENVNTPNQIK